MQVWQRSLSLSFSWLFLSECRRVSVARFYHDAIEPSNLFIEAIWEGMARPSLKFGSQMMYRIHRFFCRFPADREQVRSYALRAEAWTYE